MKELSGEYHQDVNKLLKENNALRMVMSGLIKGSEILIDDLSQVDDELLIDFKEMLTMAKLASNTHTN